MFWMPVPKNWRLEERWAKEGLKRIQYGREGGCTVLLGDLEGLGHALLGDVGAGKMHLGLEAELLLEVGAAAWERYGGV